MPRDIVVLGAGGFGREVLDVIEAHNAANPHASYHVLGVLDDAPTALNLERVESRGYRYLAGIGDFLNNHKPVAFALGVGSPCVRRRIAEAAAAAGFEPVTLVHPTANIGSVASVGGGSIICGGVQISTNTVIGAHVHLNPGAVVGHDAQLGDFVSVNPGAIVSGEVTVGSETLIGAGAVVLQGIEVGSGVTVGAMACVTKHVPSGATVKGVPARVA